MSQIGEIIEGHPLIHAESSDNVRDVARMMSTANVGAVAVRESGRLVGIFSQRDAMSRVVAECLEPDTTRVSDRTRVGTSPALPRESAGVGKIRLHGGPFRLVERSTEFEVDQGIVGVKNVSHNER